LAGDVARIHARLHDPTVLVKNAPEVVEISAPPESYQRRWSFTSRVTEFAQVWMNAA
jgi:hypothetical protein